jgi:RNA polymerase sigma-70 factor (ECF subfamily)
MSKRAERETAETRFRVVFSNLGDVTAYARRRGSSDPDAIAAETMAVAWRRLADVPDDDPRPWLFATARNLLLAERRERLESSADCNTDDFTTPTRKLHELDPELLAALRSLPAIDRETLFLIAWEDLSPSLAARSLGITQGAFRVRLHRARRRLQRALDNGGVRPSIHLDCIESERP